MSECAHALVRYAQPSVGGYVTQCSLCGYGWGRWTEGQYLPEHLGGHILMQHLTGPPGAPPALPVLTPDTTSNASYGRGQPGANPTTKLTRGPG